MTDTYRVLAPYVYVQVRTSGGTEVQGVYQDALLPPSTLPESIEAHLRKTFHGRPMIERVGGPLPAARVSTKKDRSEPGPAQEQVETLPAPAPEPEPEPEPESEPEPAEVTAPAAPPSTGPGSGKAAWVEYAVALGYDRQEVTQLGRDELISLTTEGAED